MQANENLLKIADEYSQENHNKTSYLIDSKKRISLGKDTYCLLADFAGFELVQSYNTYKGFHYTTITGVHEPTGSLVSYQLDMNGRIVTLPFLNQQDEIYPHLLVPALEDSNRIDSPRIMRVLPANLEMLDTIDRWKEAGELTHTIPQIQGLNIEPFIYIGALIRERGPFTPEQEREVRTLETFRELVSASKKSATMGTALGKANIQYMSETVSRGKIMIK